MVEGKGGFRSGETIQPNKWWDMHTLLIHQGGKMLVQSILQNNDSCALPVGNIVSNPLTMENKTQFIIKIMHRKYIHIYPRPQIFGLRRYGLAIIHVAAQILSQFKCFMKWGTSRLRSLLSANTMVVQSWTGLSRWCWQTVLRQLERKQLGLRT